VSAEDRTKNLFYILKQINALLIDQGGLVITGEKSLEAFDLFMKDGFIIYYKEKKESLKVELLQTIKKLVESYYKQQIVQGGAGSDPKVLLSKSQQQTFIPLLSE